MTTTTDDLVAAARAGNEDALLELIKLCGPQLRRYASRECVSEDIEEAVQDALWLLYRRVGALRRIGAFWSWLFQIIRRECLRRTRKRANIVAWDDEAVSELNDRGSMVDEELRIDIMRAMSELPQSYREILILRDITGFSSEETAGQLNIPVPAAKSRLHRARQMLRVRVCSAATKTCLQTDAGGRDPRGLRQ
jgi:RNA polymerase sigma factor (sigma-70 family)